MRENSKLPLETTAEKPQTLIRDYSGEDYREFWSGPAKAFLHRVESKIVRKILPSTSGWFIDLGGGFGRLLPTYLDSRRQIVLVDYAIHLLELACQKYPYDNIHYVAANAYRTPFRDGVFSGGLCVRVFHHMKAPQLFLNEFARIVHEGSSVVISYSNKRNLLRIPKHGLRCFRCDHEEIRKMLFGTHPAYFENLSRSAGFRVQLTRGTGFFDQVVRAAGILERLLNKIPSLMVPVALAEAMADATLGRMGLAPINLALSRKVAGDMRPSTDAGKNPHLLNILDCPYCRTCNLKYHEGGFTCLDCRRIFAKKGKIFDFRCDEKPANE